MLSLGGLTDGCAWKEVGIKKVDVFSTRAADSSNDKHGSLSASPRVHSEAEASSGADKL